MLSGLPWSFVTSPQPQLMHIARILPVSQPPDESFKDGPDALHTIPAKTKHRIIHDPGIHRHSTNGASYTQLGRTTKAPGRDGPGAVMLCSVKGVERFSTCEGALERFGAAGAAARRAAHAAARRAAA